MTWPTGRSFSKQLPRDYKFIWTDYYLFRHEKQNTEWNSSPRIAENFLLEVSFKNE